MNICRLFGVPSVMTPVVADGMDFVVFRVVGFAQLMGFLLDRPLHLRPLFLGHFHLLRHVRIEHVAVDDDGLHGGTAMSLQWHAVHAAHPSFLGVVRAVRATRTCPFSYRNQQRHKPSISTMWSAILSVSASSISAKASFLAISSWRK